MDSYLLIVDDVEVAHFATLPYLYNILIETGLCSCCSTCTGYVIHYPAFFAYTGGVEKLLLKDIHKQNFSRITDIKKSLISSLCRIFYHMDVRRRGIGGPGAIDDAKEIFILRCHSFFLQKFHSMQWSFSHVNRVMSDVISTKSDYIFFMSLRFCEDRSTLRIYFCRKKCRASKAYYFKHLVRMKIRNVPVVKCIRSRFFPRLDHLALNVFLRKFHHIYNARIARSFTVMRLVNMIDTHYSFYHKFWRLLHSPKPYFINEQSLVFDHSNDLNWDI